PQKEPQDRTDGEEQYDHHHPQDLREAPGFLSRGGERIEERVHPNDGRYERDQATEPQHDYSLSRCWLRRPGRRPPRGWSRPTPGYRGCFRWVPRGGGPAPRIPGSVGVLRGCGYC